MKKDCLKMDTWRWNWKTWLKAKAASKEILSVILSIYPVFDTLNGS
ncbi:MAG TPA: hypothetical protein GXX65_07820 [Methanosarcina sp.]|nr:hypothetical protein [Methanosarcina sp.]